MLETRLRNDGHVKCATKGGNTAKAQLKTVIKVDTRPGGTLGCIKQGLQIANMRLVESQIYSHPAYTVNKSILTAVKLVNLTKWVAMW